MFYEAVTPSSRVLECFFIKVSTTKEPLTILYLLYQVGSQVVYLGP